MSKEVVYVAGPYRSKKGWNAVWQNIMLARAVSRRLWLKGYAVICPHCNTIMMDGDDIPDRTFLDGDLEIMSRCDIVCMIGDWTTSEGARTEQACALAWGKKVVYFRDLTNESEYDIMEEQNGNESN